MIVKGQTLLAVSLLIVLGVAISLTGRGEVEPLPGRGEGAFRRQGLHESQVTHLHGLRQALPPLFPDRENR